MAGAAEERGVAQSLVQGWALWFIKKAHVISHIFYGVTDISESPFLIRFCF